MTKEEKELQIVLGTYLPLKWRERNEQRAKWGSPNALSDRLYVNAVREVHGDDVVTIDWNTGEVLKEIVSNG